MKGIYDIFADHGIEIAEDKKKDFEKDLYANYKSVEEVSKKDEQITSLTDQLNTAKEGLKKFEGVDVDKLNGEITKLNSDLAAKDKEWGEKLSNLEFSNLVSGTITAAKGKNAKAIMALIDEDTMKSLRSSKNQADDVKTAIENIKKDNEYLFESEETPGQYAGGTGTGKGNKGRDTSMDILRKAAGLKVEE